MLSNLRASNSHPMLRADQWRAFRPAAGPLPARWLVAAALLIAGCREDTQTSSLPGPPPETPTPQPTVAAGPDESARFAHLSSPYTGSFQGIIKPGNQARGPFFVEGQLAYPALTCVNPKCPAKGQGDNGAPLVFVREFKDVEQGPNGEILWPENPEVTPVPLCPACKQNGTIRPYVLPGTARRMEELKAELTAARAAHAAARQQGLERAAGSRTPREVMQEMESLPQLYLAPQPDAQK